MAGKNTSYLKQNIVAIEKTLKHTTSIEVKFSEADPLGIVWHGHYIRYFEDGRESFGKKYGIGYLAFYKNGYVIPVVNVQCDYKKSLRYGDTITIETEYIPTDEKSNASG